MNWTLQLIEVVVLLVMGAAAHLTVVRARRPFLEDLEALAGRASWVTATVVDVVVTLVYVAFVAAVAPPPAAPLTAPYHLEDLLDVVALGALVLAALEVSGLLAVHRVANYLEPWPPKAAVAV